MKNKSLYSVLSIGVLVTAMGIGRSVAADGNLGVSLRRHAEHKRFDDLPFGKRDHSIGISYEFHESHAFWQMGLLYTPDLSVKEGAETASDYALTPELNLILKDKAYRAGVGIASTYTDGNGGEWTTVYWQLLLGVGFDLSRQATLSGYGYYPFKGWGDLSKFDVGDMEFGIRVGWRF